MIKGLISPIKRGYGLARKELELFILLNVYEAMKEKGSERFAVVVLDMIADAEQALI